MKRNEELFRAVADQIEQHPESYNQRSIVGNCGTTACIAGWALAIAHFDSRLDEVFDYHCATLNEAVVVLGLTHKEAWGVDWEGGLFGLGWRPHDGLSVPDALRKIGEGAAIEDVSA